MELSEYKKEALRSEKELSEVKGDRDVILRAMSLAVQAAALMDYVKKVVVYGREMDYQRLGSLASNVQTAASCVEHFSHLGPPVKEEVLGINPRIFHAAIGGFGEAGESFEALLEQHETGQLDLFNVAEEAGDKLWYLALELDEIERRTGTPPAAVARANIRKLEVRYPEKFTLAASEGRDPAAERAAMVAVEPGGCAPPVITRGERGLRAAVEDGEVVIRIGREELCFAIRTGNGVEPGVKITDEAAFVEWFASNVVDFDEDTVGTSALGRVFDQLADRAAELGEPFVAGPDWP